MPRTPRRSLGTAFALVLGAALSFTITRPAQAVLLCDGLPVTIQGTPGRDRRQGTRRS